MAAERPSIIRISEVISALSFALDITEGQPMGHAVRTCVLGMRLAREAGAPREARTDLYYALLMKDAGCSSNASKMAQILGADELRAKRNVKTTDWTRVGWESLQYALAHVKTGAPFIERVRGLFRVAVHQKRNARDMVQIRCERGSTIARKIGLSAGVAEAIHSLDEHWDGGGHPAGLAGNEIPLLSRIMNLAQTAEVFHRQYGAAEAVKVVQDRSGRWFDPALARAFCTLARDATLWEDVENASEKVLEMDAAHEMLIADDETLDKICLAFADVIDAKSPFTFQHSAGVAGAAVAIARTMGLPVTEVTTIRRAALLHDIGKLGISNSILDKPDKLNPEEWAAVRRHPRYSFEILKRVPGFGELSEIAAAHHERLDGSGYFRSMTGDCLSLPARIVAVADVYDALAAKRPYRDALPVETVFRMIGKDAPHALDAECFTALKFSSESGGALTRERLAEPVFAA